MRLNLDGTVPRVRLDRKATSISLLVVLGVRADGQKVLLRHQKHGWRQYRGPAGAVLDDLIKRGLRRLLEFPIVDGARGLDKAIATVWDGVPVQRCTVHKHRNLLAHAPERLHEEIGADYSDMIYAATREDIETRRKAFISEVAAQTPRCRRQPGGGRRPESLPSPVCRRAEWRSARTGTNAIERLHEQFKAKDQNPDRAAVGRHRRYAVLGVARIRSDQHAQG